MDKKLRNLVIVLAQISLLICSSSISTTWATAANSAKEVLQLDDNGYHLSELVDPKSSLTFEQTIDLLETCAKNNDDQTETEKFLPKGGPKLVELSELVQFEAAKCTETYFRQLVEWRQLFGDQTPLARYVKKVITTQRRFCEQYLAGETQMEIESFGEETKFHFDLFLKQDEIGQDFYVSPDNSITKLRSIISELESEETSVEDVIEMGQKYLTACQEIVTKFGRLVPIRKNHEIFARLPLRPDRYFRAYDFCRYLIDFNFSEELAKMIDLDVRSRDIIRRFGSILNQFSNQIVVELNDIKQTHTQIIPRAAAKYAQEFVNHRQRERDSNQNYRIQARPDQYKFKFGNKPLEQAVDHLKQACTTSLDWVDNLLWLRRHNLENLKLGKLTARARMYLDLFKNCQKLIEIKTDVVIDEGLTESEKKQIFKEERRRNSPINKLWRLFSNKKRHL